MLLLSVNVAQPRTVTWQGRDVTTSFFKAPVTERIRVRHLNLDGDRQADLTVHGGADKAIYVYPSEHYPFWQNDLGEELAFGSFGENFTTEGLDEESVRLGDRLRIGSAEVVVTQPRTPCYKLSVRFRRADMVRRFHLSGRSGFYLRVTREGEVQIGDPIEWLERDANDVSVADLNRLVLGQTDDGILARVLRVEALPDGWKEHIATRRR